MDARKEYLALVGARVRFLRELQGLPQMELSYLAGLSKNYVSELELGKRNPTALTLLRLARILGVAPSALLPLPEAPEPVKRD